MLDTGKYDQYQCTGIRRRIHHYNDLDAYLHHYRVVTKIFRRFPWGGGSWRHPIPDNARTSPRVLLFGLSIPIVIAMAVPLKVGADSSPSPSSQASPASQPILGVHPVLSGTTTLSHGHFRYDLSPGSSIQDAIVVENLSDKPITVDIYGADLLQAQGGGVAPAQQGQPSHGVGGWISVEQSQVTIPVHMQTTDHFSLAVPAFTSPGDHLGAIVAQTNTGTTNGITLQVRAALIADVFVPGTANPSGKVAAFTSHNSGGKSYTFAADFKNIGNILLTTQGRVTIKDSHGNAVGHLTLVPTQAYAIPSGTLDLHSGNWTFTPGSYTVQATITAYAGGKVIGQYNSKPLPFNFPAPLPVALVIGGIVGGTAVVLGGAGAWFQIRRNRLMRIKQRIDLRKRIS
jgi:hypothetical protein